MIKFEFRRFILGILLVLNFIPCLISNTLEDLINKVDRYDFEDEQEKSKD